MGSGSDFDGHDAFAKVLETMIESEGRNAVLRNERDEARAAQHVFEAEQRRMQSIVSRCRAREAQDDAIHEVLKDVAAHFGANPLEASEPNVALLARLKKAVEDTDPIPF